MVFPQVRLSITTNGGANLHGAGHAEFRGHRSGGCRQILVNSGDAGATPPSYGSMTRGRSTAFRSPGNAFVFYGLDLLASGRLGLDAAVASTSSWALPSSPTRSHRPHRRRRGITGTISTTASGLLRRECLVTFDENGPTPGKIIARAPSGSGQVTVGTSTGNLDGRPFRSSWRRRLHRGDSGRTGSSTSRTP